MSIEQSALVLVDLQKEGGFGLEGLNHAVQKSSKVIDACRAREFPSSIPARYHSDGVSLSRGESLDENRTPRLYNAASDAIEIFDKIRPRDVDIVIDKYRWRAFFETSLDLTLKKPRRNQPAGGRRCHGWLPDDLCFRRLFPGL